MATIIPAAYLLIITAFYFAGATPESKVHVRFRAIAQEQATCERVERAIVGTMRRNGAKGIKSTGCR